MKLLRRVISALTLAVLFTGALRIRGSGGTPPQHGGWRPLDIGAGPDGPDAADGQASV